MSDWSSKEQAFLDAVKKDWGPSAAASSAVREGVAQQVASPEPHADDGAPGPSPASPAAGANALGLKALAGALAVGAVALGLAWLGQAPGAPSPGAAAPTVLAPSVAPSASPAAPLPAAVAAPAAPIPTEAVSVDSLPNAAAPAPSAVRTAPSASPPARGGAGGSGADTLAEELGLLRTAQSALRNRAPAEALAALAAHASRFPGGVLREERMTLQVLALCDSGQVEAARAARDALVRVAPGSSHLQRLASSCVAP